MFLDEIWCAIETCHPQLKENVQELKRTEYSSPDQSELLLFEGVERDVVDFGPVFELAAELFTHIGVAFMNPEGRHHGMSKVLTRSPSTSGTSAEDLKLLALKRDGTSCPLTHVAFFGKYDFRPTLAHVIPPSIHDKPETLRYIKLMAGDKVVDAFMGEGLDSINNVMVIEASTASSYCQHRWGIEACNISGDRGTPPKYIFRSIPHDFDHSTGLISLQDGDEIHFGAGPEGDQLNLGPHPLLCNLRLAVARVLHTSGAADL
ncbi:hypothetical protein Hypma_006276 [Hypsizygus marmoreus]|uniref:HNH nuclease domain-containing protein n=1 Tax=Hypsizygus marmoreus TaxID=39966 RepID=A0A369JXB2_HYPMA|nr:hypothetical protein Hypma_006276 [Hypsizygus marmoreus]